MVKDVVALVINIFYQVSQSVGSFGRSSGSGGCSGYFLCSCGIIRRIYTKMSYHIHFLLELSY